MTTSKEDEIEPVKQDTPAKPKKDAPAHPAPAEFTGLPKGKDGKPETIDNPTQVV